MLTVATPVARRRRVSVETKAEAPAFLADVESTLINLGYKRKQAAQAVERSNGEHYELRLKNALCVLRQLEAN
jgi:Holliday junction resolvasome RuvABC DNA-binding subunit